MEVTRRTDYAIRLLVALAQQPGGTFMSASELAAMQEVPRAVARSVLSDLARAGLVTARKGARGGMGLGAPPESISLLAVVEAIEGPIALSLCSNDPEYCGYTEVCSMHRVWLEAEDVLRSFLASRTLADLGGAVGTMGLRPLGPPAVLPEGGPPG